MKSNSQKLKDKVKPQGSLPYTKKCCKNCLKGKRLSFNNDVLCPEKGIVSSDYVCSSHRFFTLEEFKKTAVLHCSDCEFFILHPHEYLTTYGVCDLFSVRKCDGGIKRACSRFVKRKESIA